MPESRRKPEVAKVEDCDSDGSQVVPNTVRAARVSQRPSASSTRTTKTVSYRRVTNASDSGYSSHHSAPQKAGAPAVKPVETLTRRNTTTNSSPANPKPSVLVHKDSSRTAQPAGSSISVRVCNDQACNHPACERRYTLPNRPMAQRQCPNDAQHYRTPEPQAAMNTLPPTRPIASRPRPMSFHAGYGPSAPLAQPLQYPSYLPQQQPVYYDAPATSPYMSAFPPSSPIMPSPTSPTYSVTPAYASNRNSFSARQNALEFANADPVSYTSRPVSGTNQISARQATEKMYYDPRYAEYEDSRSESEYSSEEEDRRVRRPQSRRRSQIYEQSIPASRPSRPAPKKYATETSVPQHRRRESRPRAERAPRSDPDMYFSDARNDSDRTARADVGGRGNAYSSRSSRHSSTATSSSGRTKTTQSTNTDYSTLEDRGGRRKSYLSKEDITARRRLQDELELQDRAATYQRNVGGGGIDTHELTAENIRRRENRKSASHISTGRSSHKTSGSGGGGGGVKIQSGETVLHVYGEAQIEMRQSENGGTAFVIGATAGNREKSYLGSSKGSGSRSGRDRERGRSDVRRRTIREENRFDEAGYEKQR